MRACRRLPTISKPSDDASEGARLGLIEISVSPEFPVCDVRTERVKNGMHTKQPETSATPGEPTAMSISSVRRLPCLAVFNLAGVTLVIKQKDPGTSLLCWSHLSFFGDLEEPDVTSKSQKD